MNECIVEHNGTMNELKSIYITGWIDEIPFIKVIRLDSSASYPGDVQNNEAKKANVLVKILSARFKKHVKI